MAKFEELKKYLNHEFSSVPYTGEDYKKFQNKYINYLRKLCIDNGWQLVSVNRNHYCFSAFIKNPESKFVYLSISDVRFRQDWFYDVLIRRAKNEKDYRWYTNWHSPLQTLQTEIEMLFRRP